MAENIYKELLYNFQNSPLRVDGSLYPAGHPYADINWNQRAINLPVDYDPFLIEGDHMAARVWFRCDKYFDAINLSDLTCIIEYVNPQGESRIAPILVIDDKTDPEKLYFSWEVNGEAAKLPAGVKKGELQFVIRFYTIDPVTKKFWFNMSTMPCSANVVKGLKPADDTDINYGYPANDVQNMYDRLSTIENILENQSINWYDLEPEELI